MASTQHSRSACRQWLLLMVAAFSLLTTNASAQTPTLVKDINLGAGSAVSVYWTNDPGVSGNVLYFFADDGTHGVELWKSDGTEGGTAMVRDINPGPASSIGSTYHNFSKDFTFIGGVVYFVADNGVHGRELWRSDGTTGGTYLVKDVTPGTSGDGPSSLASVAGTLYFNADDTTLALNCGRATGPRRERSWLPTLMSDRGDLHPTP